VTAGQPVSVLMVVRDGGAYLAAALDSVLGQTLPPAQVVVIDDGSTDGTLEVLHAYGSAVSVLTQPPTGVAAGMNKARRAAKHSLLAYLDADDLWEPDSLECRHERLTADDAPDVVGGLTLQFVSPELTRDQAAGYRVDERPTRAALFGALLFHRARTSRFGPLDEPVRLAPAVDWVGAARLAGITEAWVDQVVLRRRVHLNNSSTAPAAREYAGLFDAVRRQHRRRTGERPPGGVRPTA
jgi:GT2 family glycosyltransferase